VTLLDTTFLVDLLRERRRGVRGPANVLLEDRLADEELATSIHAACELYGGAEVSAHPSRERKRVRDLLGALHVTVPDDRFAPTYGRLLADLRRAGTSVGTMDLLIAVAALGSDATLVTRNTREFSRIPGLDVLSY
jgi:tRNA(fMet)-specific endonuclease VapC